MRTSRQGTQSCIFESVSLSANDIILPRGFLECKTVAGKLCTFRGDDQDGLPVKAGQDVMHGVTRRKLVGCDGITDVS